MHTIQINYSLLNLFMKKRNPFIAGVLSLIAPGLGNLYSAKTKYFYFTFTTYIFLSFASNINNMYIFLISGVLSVLLWIFSIIFSFIQAKRIKEIEINKLKKIYIYFLIIIISITSNIYTGSNYKFTNYNIPAGGMLPTLQVGDYIIVSKNYYLKNKPDYGDIVIFKSQDDTDYIKRIIGLPNDTIRIVDGQILLNDKLIKQTKTNDFISQDGTNKRVRKYKENLFNLDYEVLDLIDKSIADNTNIFKVPDGQYFVMGDNRDNSLDSRFKQLGFVPKNKILHKPKIIYWSKNLSRIGKMPK